MHVLNDNLGACDVVMMLHELHQRGYEQLRLFCGWAPSGLYWRWLIYPKCMMGTNANWEKHDDCTPFDCPHGTAIRPKGNWQYKEAADELLQSANELLSLGKLPDEEYINWFAPVVEHAQQGSFPVGFGEYFGSNDSWLYSPGQERLEYPPFTPTNLDAVSDNMVLAIGKQVLDDYSKLNLQELEDFDGIVPPLQEITNVIRQCIREDKVFYCHTDLAIEQKMLYAGKDITKERRDGNKIWLKLKDGKEVELIDTIEIAALNRK